MSVADLVQDALASSGPVCMPGLAAPLSRSRWDALTRSRGLNHASYGTSRYLEADADVAREDLLRLDLPREFASSGCVVVETLRGKVQDRYVELGLDFYPDGAPDPGVTERRLTRAMSRIARVPDAAAAVGSLLAILHVIRPPGPDYDVSYSDPVLPFSAFVGISEEDAPCGDLRLAEGILHECMHLQLSLVEEVVPMVAGSEDRLRSPWQGVLRPTQGNLHGLYVFRVLQWFHSELILSGTLTDLERRHSEERVRTIEEEVSSLRDLTQSRDLTHAGHMLSLKLLASWQSPVR